MDSRLQTLHLEHLPPTHGVHVAVFRNVRNAPFLHRQLLEGNTEFQYAFVDAAVVSARSRRTWFDASLLTSIADSVAVSPARGRVSCGQ